MTTHGHRQSPGTEVPPATLGASAASQITLAACAAMDSRDSLAHFLDEFLLPPGVVYLDGNSLGGHLEECDDGNNLDGDGCDATCQSEDA